MSDAQENQEVSEEITMDQILSEPNVETQEVHTEATPEPVKQQPKFDVSGIAEKFSKMDQIINHFETERVNKEINSAVSKISELSGVKSESQCKFMLQEKYDNDPSFRKIYDARNSNPQALEKALDLVAKETAKEFGRVIDPNLAETQSALLDANIRSTSGGGEAPNPYKEQEKELMNLSDDDFNKAIGKILQG